jgi:hypothetical protein
VGYKILSAWVIRFFPRGLRNFVCVGCEILSAWVAKFCLRGLRNFVRVGCEILSAWVASLNPPYVGLCLDYVWIMFGLRCDDAEQILVRL